MNRNKNKSFGVFIVVDHPLIRYALVNLINQEKNFAVCGAAADVETSLKAIAQAKPSAVLIDLSLGTGKVMRLIEELQSHHPHLYVLVMSMLDDAIFTERCLRAGAKGCINRSEEPQEVIQALRTVIAGRIAVSEGITSSLLSSMREKTRRSDWPLANLTNRELEVFQLLGEGLSTRKIAEKMCRSVKTINTHIDRLKKKLKLKDIRELLIHASRFRSDHHQKKSHL
jgi:DNA-binding NarL/FixJ family response regulator